MATKQFQNAKLNVTHLDLKDDASRSVLQSGENISHSLGKIARWYKDIIWTDSKATTEAFGIIKLSDDYKSESTETVPTSKTLNDVVKLIKQTGGWNNTYEFNTNIDGDENLQNGQFKVTEHDIEGDINHYVTIKGLGSAAYTESSDYATADHTHLYAGSDSVGGVANSAAKLSDIPVGGIGSETKPVFFSGTTGRPVACTYSLNATVPANAIFTDEKVKQSPVTTDGSFEVLFAGSTGNTEKTEGVGKTTTLTFNPSTGALSATSFSGNGSGLTSLNATNISSGTLAVDRLPGSAVTIGTYGPAVGGTLSHSGTFDVPDFTVDAKGRITSAHTRTFTLPAQYTHPTHTSKTSGLYKITVDSLGHVSGTAAVTKSDIPALDYISSTTTRNPNVVLAGPASGTAAAAPTFRALVAADLPASGATAGSYGPSENATPGYGATFNVPYITIDAKGRVTAISTKTVKIPASDNTNTTYTFATGDNSGTFKVTPSGGTATNVAIRGISHVAGDSNGVGMTIGAGGLTVLGSGESASALVTATSLKGTDETLFLTSDTAIGFYVNCQAISERKGITLDASLYLYPNSSNIGSIGTSSSKWASMYATTFYGALSGNATTATTWQTARTLTIGSTGKSVNGSANVSWTLAEIGAAASNHNHSKIVTEGDNRKVATTPNDYISAIRFRGLKEKATINDSTDTPFNNTYAYLVGLRGWADSAGGYSHELAFSGNSICHRSGSTTAWGKWKNIAEYELVNGYWGMVANGATNVWIRTTQNGIIPYQRGSSGSGHQSLGTSSWYFLESFIDKMWGSVVYADRFASRNGSIDIQPNYDNEINFGGTSGKTAIYFGYRAAGSRPKPTEYIFGDSEGARITCNDVKIGGTSTYCIFAYNDTDECVDFVFG